MSESAVVSRAEEEVHRRPGVRAATPRHPEPDVARHRGDLPVSNQEAQARWRAHTARRANDGRGDPPEEPGGVIGPRTVVSAHRPVEVDEGSPDDESVVAPRESRHGEVVAGVEAAGAVQAGASSEPASSEPAPPEPASTDPARSGDAPSGGAPSGGAPVEAAPAGEASALRAPAEAVPAAGTPAVAGQTRGTVPDASGGGDPSTGPDRSVDLGGVVVPDEAAEPAAAIEAETATSITVVRAQAAQRRAALAAQERTFLGAVDEPFSRAMAQVAATVTAGTARVAGWLTAGVRSVVSVIGLFGSVFLARAVAVVGSVASATTVLVSVAARGAAAVAAGIVSFAVSLPIPDLPGVGRVRQGVRAIAASAADAVRGASRAVATFAGNVVAETAGLLTRVAAHAAAQVRRAGAAVLALVAQAVLAVRTALMAVGRSVASVLRAGLGAARAAVRRHFRDSRAQVDEIERETLASLGENRHAALVAITSDPDPDPESNDDQVAMLRAENTRLVAAAFGRLVRVVGLAVASATQYVVRTAAQAFDAPRLLAASVDRAVVALIAAATQHFGRAVLLVSGYAGRVLAAVGAAGRIASGIAAAPLAALGGAAARVVGGVQALLRRVLTPVRGALQGISAGLERSLTAGLRAITVPRLRAAARMASPPAAAAVMVIPVVAVGVELAVVLFWVGVVLLVIAVLVLIWLLYTRWAQSQPQPVPRDRPMERVRDRVRRWRRRRRSKKPFRWRLMAGWSYAFLDWNGRLIRGNPTHIEQHHVWPEYVGGPAVQTRMPVRVDIHQWVLHPELHAAMAAFAQLHGFTIVRNAPAIAFVQHLRQNPTDLGAFAAILEGYYVTISAQTEPGIPPMAYSRGIAESLAVLSGP